MAKGMDLGEVQSKFNPPQEIQHLRDKVRELEGRLSTEKKATGEARLQLIQLTESLEAAEPPKMVYKPSNKSETPITAVLHLTDLHNGEVTDPDEVEGFGAFNPEIFDARLELLVNRFLNHVKVQRAGLNIPKLQVIGTGDYISGGIHPELLTTNAYPEPVQATRAGLALGKLLEVLSPHFEEVVSDLDNARQPRPSDP
jgi:hypothetical protein